MVARDLQPLSIVDDPGFRSLLVFFCPEMDTNWSIPSTDFIGSRLSSMFAEKKAQAILCFAKVEWVSITMDTWTSRATKSFGCITAHYLSEDFAPLSLTLCVQGTAFYFSW
jgi:hypothetical protein